MFKKFFRKVRETVKKIAPIAAPIAGMALGPLAGMGIGALMGQYGGKKGALTGAMLGGLGGLSKGLLGNLSQSATGPIQGMEAVSGKGILGTLQNLLGGESGKLGVGKLLGNDLVQKYGIPALIGMFTKNQLDNQDMSKANINDYRSLIDEKYGSVTGGSPFAADNFRGMQYNPVNEQYYDYKTTDGDYKNFKIDDDGKIIEDISVASGFNDGGIAALNFGGAPHRMSFQVNQQPVLNRAVGGEIFDSRMSGNEMMKKIEDNPGITQYFPPKFGEITGPGGPKDDKIPAMLSDGEFVMTAKAVDNAGGPKAMYNLMNKLDPESSKGKGILS